MSASAPKVFGCGPCCFNPGQLLQVSAKGSLTSIGGVECYRTGSDKEKVVLYSTDVFGLLLDNTKFISDSIAAGGFTVVVPNILHDAMDPTKPIDSAKFPEWLARNTPESAAAILEKVAHQLQAEGFKSISVIGYCYGAKPAWHLQVKNAHIKVAAYSHPSFLAMGDGAKLHKNSSLLVNCAETDGIYTPELQSDFEQGAKHAGVHLQVIYYPKTKHGFAARVIDDDKAKGMRDLEAATINILKFLQLNA